MSDKPIQWILVPLHNEEDKRAFIKFIKDKTGKRIRVPTQYSNGLVMLLVSPDLSTFDLTNITCVNRADYKTNTVQEFINNYESIKKKADIDKPIKKQREIDFIICKVYEHLLPIVGYQKALSLIDTYIDDFETFYQLDMSIPGIAAAILHGY